MSRSKVIYDPTKTIEEIAASSGVSVATVRRYIKDNNINRQFDEKLLKYNRVREYMLEHRAATYSEVAAALGMSKNSVIKYANMRPPKNDSHTKISRVAPEEITQSIMSVSDNQWEIIANIVKLHLNGASTFDCDLTVSRGGFYTHGTPRPLHCFDKYPIPGYADVRDLEEAKRLPDARFRSVIIDLPYIINGVEFIEGSNAPQIRPESKFTSVEDMTANYTIMIKLASRLLQKGGKLIFKTRDIPTRDGQFFASQKAIGIASVSGLKLIDNFIQLLKLRKKREKLSDKTARIAHCYYLVFQKL